MKKIVFAMFLLVPGMTYAQDGLDVLLTNSIADGKKLMDGYIDPFMKSTSLGLGQGWYNTAKPHKLAGFDLTFTGSAMIIPTSDLFYDVSKIDLATVELDPSSPDYPKAPTIFGPDREPVYRITDVDDPDYNTTFEGPGGLDLKGNIGNNWMPVPMLTLGFGLPKGTDIKVRFAPTIDVGDDGSVKLFGIGVMHDIKQYIPGLKLLPFDLSGFVGFTKLSLDYKYTDDDVDGENQRGEFRLNTTTIQGVISKKLSVVTFYGGMGYTIAKSNVAVKGTWDVNENGTIEDEESNPVNLNYNASSFSATAGFRLKLAVITLHTDYTFQKYNAFTVGFGINVR